MDYSRCDFTEKNMKAKDKNGTTREGAGRVAIFKLTGVKLCYTLECNYNMGTLRNNVRDRISEDLV